MVVQPDDSHDGVRSCNQCIEGFISPRTSKILQYTTSRLVAALSVLYPDGAWRLWLEEKAKYELSFMSDELVEKMRIDGTLVAGYIRIFGHIRQALAAGVKPSEQAFRRGYSRDGDGEEDGKDLLKDDSAGLWLRAGGTVSAAMMPMLNVAGKSMKAFRADFEERQKRIAVEEDGQHKVEIREQMKNDKENDKGNEDKDEGDARENELGWSGSEREEEYYELIELEEESQRLPACNNDWQWGFLMSRFQL